MERSYIMLKPGFLQYEEQIIERVKAIGGEVLYRKQFRIERSQALEHYAHVPSQFLDSIADYMVSDDVVGFVIGGESGIIAKIREIVGPTKNAPAGTIRGDFGIGDITRNVIHASDAVETAEIEIKRFCSEFLK